MRHLLGFAGAKVVKMYETTKCLGNFFQKMFETVFFSADMMRVMHLLFAKEVAGEIVVELLLVEVAEG